MKIKIGGQPFEGFSVKTENSIILLIKGRNGILGCGYFSIEAADKLKDAFAIVTGVNSFEDMLEKGVVKISEAARKKGIKEGMTGKETLTLMNVKR